MTHDPRSHLPFWYVTPILRTLHGMVPWSRNLFELVYVKKKKDKVVSMSLQALREVHLHSCPRSIALQLMTVWTRGPADPQTHPWTPTHGQGVGGRGSPRGTTPSPPSYCQSLCASTDLLLGRIGHRLMPAQLSGWGLPECCCHGWGLPECCCHLSEFTAALLGH